MTEGTKKSLLLLQFCALSTILAPTAVFADDDAKTGTTASTDARKPGLTERERMLIRHGQAVSTIAILVNFDF